MDFQVRIVEILQKTEEFVIVLTSELPSFVFVCPSNCGSGCLIEIIAVKPSRTSSPDKFWISFFNHTVFPSIVIYNTR